MCRLYANTVILYKGLDHQQVLVSSTVLKLSPADTEGHLYTSKSNLSLLHKGNFSWPTSTHKNFFQKTTPQFSSVTQLCPTLCDPMNHSTLGLPVHHQLPEFTQTYIHRVGDAIQPSHPLSSPSPPAPNPSQHQGLFQ